MSADANESFTLIVTVPIKSGMEEEYLSILHPVLDAMRHESTFLHTTVHRAADDPGLFVLYETWTDRDNFFAVQRNRSYRAEHEARLPQLLRAPRTMTVFETLRTDSARASA